MNRHVEDAIIECAVMSNVMEKAGTWIILIVSIWDFVLTGARGFFEYAIDYKGIVLIWIGVFLIKFAKYCYKQVN